MLRTRLVLSVAAAAAGLTLLSACAGGGSTPAPAAQVVPAGSGGGNAAVQAPAQAPAAEPTKLAVAEAGGLGQVLTDKDGMTLYRFNKDTAKPPKSTCDGDCAKTWPPVTSRGEVEATGVDKSLVGKVTRADGSEQVTVGGWPLYKFSKDTKAGDTKGQGVSGTWYAANAKGAKAGPEATKLIAGNVDGVGPVITDKEGFTLYLFTKDTKKATKSACEGDCAKTWPAVLAKGKVELEGVASKLVSSIKRADGSEQVTVGGWPVYRYAMDTQAGEAKGAGVKGTWFPIEPNGCKSGTTPAASSSAAPSTAAAPSNSGYGSGY
ncbi:SCO0930 family lipoprotein [Amycolatopsis sp. H20-H5]|uniref:SCO0930 family lipoprotein n=1 Tax=Amycolatopsis sp. H20-H5 TaxID=3046309 RepID=UPI002DB67EAF|nr:SCO0930 family lipoprotein [Amycolatopsis sp. H20-H5]MEC3978829.1 SCO0930 family lipoprotein [Amycolatopsis sp. H20-H5]